MFTRSTFLEWLGEVFNEVAPNNQYEWRWTSGVGLIKRLGVRLIPWFRVVVQHTLLIFPYLSLKKFKCYSPKKTHFWVYLASHPNIKRGSRAKQVFYPIMTNGHVMGASVT